MVPSIGPSISCDARNNVRPRTPCTFHAPYRKSRQHIFRLLVGSSQLCTGKWGLAAFVAFLACRVPSSISSPSPPVRAKGFQRLLHVLTEVSSKPYGLNARAVRRAIIVRECVTWFWGDFGEEGNLVATLRHQHLSGQRRRKQRCGISKRRNLQYRYRGNGSYSTERA